MRHKQPLIVAAQVARVQALPAPARSGPLRRPHAVRHLLRNLPRTCDLDLRRIIRSRCTLTKFMGALKVHGQFMLNWPYAELVWRHLSPPRGHPLSAQR
jgi:hypothetical protein